MQVQDYTKNSARDLDSLINVLDPYFFLKYVVEMRDPDSFIQMFLY
jgi:hypothetical protein